VAEERRFYIDTSGVDDKAVAEGWTWLLREAVNSEEKLGWVAVNAVEVAPRLGRAIGDVAAVLTRDRLVRAKGLSIGLITNTRAKSARWVPAPVLAVWPSERLLSRIEDDLRPPAVLVIPWTTSEIDAWITGHQPIEVRTGHATTTAATISNPVVEAALTSLTQIIDMGTGQVDLTDFRDRAAAIQAMQILYDGGEAFLPAEIGPWAIANGWEMRAARELQEIAEKTKKGARLRGSRQAGRRWATDALTQWRGADIGENSQ
jgi:hypothetical protein